MLTSCLIWVQRVSCCSFLYLAMPDGCADVVIALCLDCSLMGKWIQSHAFVMLEVEEEGIANDVNVLHQQGIVVVSSLCFLQLSDVKAPLTLLRLSNYDSTNHSEYHPSTGLTCNVLYSMRMSNISYWHCTGILVRLKGLAELGRLPY